MPLSEETLNETAPLRLAVARPAAVPSITACSLAFAVLMFAGDAMAADGLDSFDLYRPYTGASGQTEKPGAPKDKAAARTSQEDDEIDSEHIFGFTHGTDIGKKGELELEIEPVAAIGKRFGTYFATSQLVAFKYTVTDSFRVAPELFVATHDIRGVHGFEDRQGAGFASASFETRYRVFDRETRPFGLTLNFDPGWSRIDELTGASVEQYTSEFGIFLDKDIIPDRLFGAINLNYGIAATRLRTTGEWFHDSAASIDLSLTQQVRRGLFIGAEARYSQVYEGLGLDRFRGEALYFGPTFFMRIGKNAGLSGAWNFQVVGKAVDDPGALDLINHERQQVLLRLNIILNPD
ncbi:MAG: hypothetical protein ACXW6T_27655 [Candidatus Binatia bacterium]